MSKLEEVKIKLLGAKHGDKEVYEDEFTYDVTYTFNSNQLFAFAREIEAKAQESADSAVPAWLPIETAPKDGSKFQAWRNYATFPRLVSYNKDFDWFEDEWGTHIYDLTHWMPVPSGPNVAVSKSDVSAVLNAMSIYLDEIDAARAGEEFLLKHTTKWQHEIVRSEETGSGKAARVKYAVLFDDNDVLRAAYILTRETFNRTQLTLAAPTIHASKSDVSAVPDVSVKAINKAELADVHKAIIEAADAVPAKEVDEFVTLSRALFDEAYKFIDHHSEDWYMSGQDLLSRLRQARAKSEVDERAEFEKTNAQRWKLPAYKSEDGRYKDEELQVLWQGWQARAERGEG